jgi:hypothetical protein
MNLFIEKFLGRNYHLALLIVGMAFGLCVSNHMTGVTFGSVALGIFTSFRAGDAVVNWIHARAPAGANFETVNATNENNSSWGYNRQCPPSSYGNSSTLGTEMGQEPIPSALPGGRDE